MLNPPFARANRDENSVWFQARTLMMKHGVRCTHYGEVRAVLQALPWYLLKMQVYAACFLEKLARPYGFSQQTVIQLIIMDWFGLPAISPAKRKS